jgi:hypothetical protein
MSGALESSNSYLNTVSQTLKAHRGRQGFEFIVVLREEATAFTSITHHADTQVLKTC